MLFQNSLAVGSCHIENALYLTVDEGGCIFGVGLCLAEVAAYEYAVVCAVERDGAERLAHAVLRNHGANQPRCVLYVVCCAR